MDGFHISVIEIKELCLVVYIFPSLVAVIQQRAAYTLRQG